MEPGGWVVGAQANMPALRSTSAKKPDAARRFGLLAAALLLLHALLAAWGALRNSVTFDENFHLPAGVAVVTRGELDVSPVNPPGLKALQALAALAAGARVPADSSWSRRGQYEAGAAFLRANGDRYHRVYFAARLITVVSSVLLAAIVWWLARSLYGAAAGALALALYALAPEAIAHAGLATMDTGTALGWVATLAAGWRFASTGRRRWWIATALAFGFALLTRFTSVLILPVLAALSIAATWRVQGLRRRVWLGVALLVPAGVAALWAGHLGQMSLLPWGEMTWHSERFKALASAVPWLRLPLPDAWLAGLDHQAFEGQAGTTPTYLFGRVHEGAVPWYFPVALALKWPVGIVALPLLAAFAGRRASGTRRVDEAFFWVPPLVLLAAGMTVIQLNVGVRYMLPLLPFACVFASRLAGPSSRRRRWVQGAVAAALLSVVVQTAAAAPWFLSSFSVLAGDPRAHDRLLNDSNVDWGQGLIALREELDRRGIGRVHLVYQGTTDPAVYGIDYVPFTGARLGLESDWLAVSSYYRAGLAQRMVTPAGRTEPVHFDLSALAALEPVARPGRCMYLYRIR
jgi:hypothetical protein